MRVMPTNDDQLRPSMRASLVAVALAGTAGVLNGFAPLWPPMQWVMVGLVVASLVVSACGLVQVQSDWYEMCEALDLKERWKRQRDRCR